MKTFEAEETKVKEIQTSDQISTEDLKEWLLNIHEKYFVELKKANELPNSFWESYSSFTVKH